MVEISEEEYVNLDNLADGLSEVHKDKIKHNRKEKGKITPPPVKEDLPKDKGPELKKSVVAFFVFALTLFIIVTGYATVVYGKIPFVVKWRNIWIETAMTTDQHRWLATSFFPARLIDEVMSAQVAVRDIGVTNVYGNKGEDAIGQDELVVGEKDKFGNEVYVNDKEEGIVILKVRDTNFVGKLVLIDDPSRVYLAATDYKGSRGEFICDYLAKENAVVGINASGFIDTGGTSLGGQISGMCVSQGEYWGSYKYKYTLLGIDRDNRLVVGGADNWENYNIRDGIQFRPTLIVNGEKVVSDSAGWGLQPRTVVGQNEDGVIMFLVIDGRQVGYSLGATMEECADILLQYGAVTAAACDGGSSSVIAYNGEIINEPSTNMPTGRYLPNAWVVARKGSGNE